MRFLCLHAFVLGLAWRAAALSVPELPPSRRPLATERGKNGFAPVRRSGHALLAAESSPQHLQWPQSLALNSAVVLNDGNTMPVQGFGTYRLVPGNETYSSVLAALKMGYRMIDTAEMYQNEADVGRAVRDSGVPRSQVFVTTKLMEGSHEYDQAVLAGMRSSQTLGLGYMDLIIMHSPHGRIVEAYDALLHLQDIGVTRSVGVSNFGVQHLRALAKYCRPTPVVNQIEMHPLVFTERKDLVDYTRANGIQITAYGSVMSGHQDLLDLADTIAQHHSKTSAQVFLRWGLQERFQVIPKSTHVQWIKENQDLYDFSLSDAEMAQLNSVNDTAVPSDASGQVASDGHVTDYWNPTDDKIGPDDIGDVSHRNGCERGGAARALIGPIARLFALGLMMMAGSTAMP